MRAACYPALTRFSGLFTRLVNICGDTIDPGTCDECLLLKALAATSESIDASMADDVICSVFVKTTFQQSPCYLSYIEFHMKRAFNIAFQATNNTDRLAILSPLRDLCGMAVDTLADVEMAVAFCTDATPHADVASYTVTNQPQAAKMVMRWHPLTSSA